MRYQSATSAHKSCVKQTEAAEETLSSIHPTDTCSSAAAAAPSTPSKQPPISANNSQIKFSAANENTILQTEGQQAKQVRSIPITIETVTSSEKKSDESKRDVKIPIEIVHSEQKEKVHFELNSEKNNMSARSIPIHRMDSGSSCGSASFSTSVPKSSSRESLGHPAQKIKMGTSAIRIPIHIQKSNESLKNEDALNERKDIGPRDFSLSATKPPQSIRTVPILKQSLSDSGVGKGFTQNQSNRSRNASSQSAQDERLQKVHEELEVII